MGAPPRPAAGNAAKFTHTGEIRIEARATNGGEMVAVSIEDTGIGIPEDKLHSIFDEFQQVPVAHQRGCGRPPPPAWHALQDAVPRLELLPLSACTVAGGHQDDAAVWRHRAGPDPG